MRGDALIFFLLFSSISVAAQDQKTLTIQKINQEVLGAANAYAKSVSCVEDQSTPETIFSLTPIKSSDDLMDAKYLVFWTGHMGCSFGSGSLAMHHAVVNAGSNGYFYVDPTVSSPAIHGLQSRFIEKLVGNSKNTMVVDQLEHTDKDSNNSPSLKYRVTYQIDDRSGKWNIINKKQLPYTPR